MAAAAAVGVRSVAPHMHSGVPQPCEMTELHAHGTAAHGVQPKDICLVSLYMNPKRPCKSTPTLKRPECPVDAGGPSGEPPAKRKLVPVDHEIPKTVFEAKQKLLFIEQKTEEVAAAIDARVGSNQSLVCQ